MTRGVGDETRPKDVPLVCPLFSGYGSMRHVGYCLIVRPYGEQVSEDFFSNLSLRTGVRRARDMLLMCDKEMLPRLFLRCEKIEKPFICGSRL